MALEVSVSIWLSDKGWMTSDSRNTFFLPLVPDSLQQDTFVEGKRFRLLQQHGVNVGRLTWFVL